MLQLMLIKNSIGQDIKGSLSHAIMLAQTKIVLQSDYEKIFHDLKIILQEIEEDKFVFSRKLEDIYMNIEAQLSVLIDSAVGNLRAKH
ncbi:hypothetical protein CEV08_03175 [Bartonella tribocorum]|uniref:Argininosuccinate lyase n=1 Tax=Bartonella tribocorum TaxID=85701 RepID=A0A2M6UWN9_9HYPH|nr:hypothetical protein CEV08_03175 [Bartonella tribocorum]